MVLLMEEDLSKSMISVKEEAFDHNIQYFKAKSLLNHEEKNNKNEKEIILVNNHKNHNLNGDENILSIENDLNNHMNDQFQLDENTGNEYFSYLEKTVKILLKIVQRPSYKIV